VLDLAISSIGFLAISSIGFSLKGALSFGDFQP
jgi:hypothetical protein